MLKNDMRVLTDVRCLRGEAPCFVIRHDHAGNIVVDPPDHFTHPERRVATRTSFGELLQREPALEDVRDLAVGWMAWRQSKSSDWQRRPIPSGDTFYFRFEAHPEEGHPRFNEIKGAIVDCWVRGESLEECRQRAVDDIREQLWLLTSIEEADVVYRENYKKSDWGLGYFEQAQFDGIVFLYQSWVSED